MFIALESFGVSRDSGLLNLHRVKSLYDEAWRANDFASSAFVVWLAGVPEVVCSTIVEVDVGFDGQSLPRLTPPEHMCFSMISTPGGQVAIWSWRGANSVAEQFVAGFNALPHQVQAAAVLRFMLEFVDTPYFSPVWWEGLSDSTRRSIVDRMTAHVQPFAMRSPKALLDDGLQATKLVVRNTGLISI